MAINWSPFTETGLGAARTPQGSGPASSGWASPSYNCLLLLTNLQWRFIDLTSIIIHRDLIEDAADIAVAPLAVTKARAEVTFLVLWVENLRQRVSFSCVVLSLLSRYVCHLNNFPLGRWLHDSILPWSFWPFCKHGGELEEKVVFENKHHSQASSSWSTFLLPFLKESW